MSLPAIAVIIPTYDRQEIVTRTVELLLENLIYDGPLTIYVSSDSGERGLPQISDPRVVALRGPVLGLGANLNFLIAQTSEPLLLQLDDDHHLVEPLNLNEHAATLTDDPTAGAIRLMGVTGHRYQATLYGRYWWVHWDSPHELYVASFRPHLKHRRFHEHYGLLPEGLRLGHTEEAWCHQCKDIYARFGGPRILIPIESTSERAWQHVGDSWQLKGH